MQNTKDTTISILVDHIKYNSKAVHNISPGKAQAIRSGEELRVSAEIENVDLDGLVESLAREYCSGNIIISCLVKALNEKSRGKKVKILQKILTEMLKHGVVDAFLDNLKKRKDSLGQKLNELELEIGNIAIDDLSIDAAE